MRRGGILLVVLSLLTFAGGCVTTREVTISARPDDAIIAIDGQNQGIGPITHKFDFHGDSEQHTVSASREGSKDQSINLTRSFSEGSLVLELKPQTKRITISVSPVSAIVRVDGKAISDQPVAQTTLELEFTADAQKHWTHHTISADRVNWASAQKEVNWDDPSPRYVLELGTLRKEVSLATHPPGAQVSLNGQNVGKTPLKLSDVPFPADPATGRFIQQRIVISKNGYDPLNAVLNWDDGKTDYAVDLPPKSKQVRIATNPPGGVVMLDGHELPRDAAGVSTTKLSFVPTDEEGTLPIFKANVSKKTADTEWYPKDLSIPWDNGRTDYSVALREIRTKPVALITPTFTRGDDGWRITPEKKNVLAMKDVTEPGEREQPTKITELPKGAIIDSLAISPDGSQILFTTLTTDSSGALRSQIQTVKTDGSGGASFFDEQSALALTPSFTPDGTQIVFASNRAGKRLSVWQMSAIGEAGITQLTGGEENVMWPVVDSSPKPRLFYTAMLDTLPQPRLYSTRLGTITRTDLARGGGLQPRINPKGDRLVFANPSEKNGNRQIYTMSDRSGPVANLSDPDADEYDASWSMDGGKIAFASNRGKDDEVGNNYDIWVIDLAHPEHPIQVTQNGSWDDRPVWDPSGRAIYFRSDRGGEWGIWKISVPMPTPTATSTKAENQ